MTRAAVLATLTSILAATTTSGHQEARRLELLDDRGAVIWTAPLDAGESFDLSFIHSAERCRWTQHYRERARRIEQTASTFPCYGAGMPTEVPTGTTRAGFTVRAVRDLGEIVMLHSRAADVTIGHRGADHRVDHRLVDGARVVLRVR